MNSKYKAVIGEKFGHWEVVSTEVKQGGFLKNTTNRSAYFKVRCKCGEEVWRSALLLYRNTEGSCRSCCKLKLPFEKSYLNKMKIRADKYNMEFNLTLDYITSIFDGKCKLSGIDIQFGKHWKLKLSDQTASLDRIDSTKGYIKGNVQWVHKDINMMKWKFTQKEFIELCKKVAYKHSGNGCEIN